MMRLTAYTICCLSLLLGSGCQSGANGFRNPFRNPFAQTFPKTDELAVAQAKPEPKSNSDVFQVAEEEGRASTQKSIEPAAVASVSPIPDTLGVSDRRKAQAKSPVEEMLQKADDAYSAKLISKAAAFYDEAVRLDPKNVHAHHRLAIIADQQQNYSLAEQHYSQALRVDPENLNLLNNLGYSYYLQGKYGDSQEYLTYVLKKDPSNSLAMRNLGLVYAALGDSSQAFALLQQGGLDPQQSQEQIQQAIAHAGQMIPSQTRMGTASVGNAAGSASTRIQPTSGQSTPVQSQNVLNPNLNSNPGFTYQPDPRTMNSQDSETPKNQFGSHPQAPNPTRVQKQTAPSPYYPEQSGSSPTEQGPSDYSMERAALNTGFGSLFPISSPENYHRAQQARPVSWEHGMQESPDARHAYYEQFGKPSTTTPSVRNAHHSSNGPRGTPAIPTSAQRFQQNYSPAGYSSDFQKYEQFPQQTIGNNQGNSFTPQTPAGNNCAPATESSQPAPSFGTPDPSSNPFNRSSY